MFLLVNSQGLYLSQIDFNDYVFEKQYFTAMKFDNKQEAEKKASALLKYKVKVVEVNLNH